VFRAFGRDVSQSGTRSCSASPARASGADVARIRSVTTTENFILSALTVKGTSQIVNAACEPHVQEMCTFLELLRREDRRQGHLDGLDRGRPKLGGADYTFSDDFHEIATFPRARGGHRRRHPVRNDHPEHFDLIDRTFAKFGAQ
jgi:UDP-N-acetylglucosamine 1-carboxyvinyltransferase